MGSQHSIAGRIAAFSTFSLHYQWLMFGATLEVKVIHF